MLYELINSLPQILQVIFLGLPNQFRALQPMVQAFIQKKIQGQNPAQLENFNRDFEALLDGIAQKDYGLVAVILERYHVPPDGFVEKCVGRMMGSWAYDQMRKTQRNGFQFEDNTMMMGDE